MRIYYEDAEVRVTSRAIWTRGRRFTLADLDRVWRQDTAVISRRVAGRVGVLAAVMAARAAVTMVSLAAGLALGAPTAAAALYALEDIRRHGRSRELWASIGGRAVLLVRTDDALRYGRVCRSLVRAMESPEYLRARPRRRPRWAAPVDQGTRGAPRPRTRPPAPEASRAP